MRVAIKKKPECSYYTAELIASDIIKRFKKRSEKTGSDVLAITSKSLEVLVRKRVPEIELHEPTDYAPTLKVMQTIGTALQYRHGVTLAGSAFYMRSSTYYFIKTGVAKIVVHRFKAKPEPKTVPPTVKRSIANQPLLSPASLRAKYDAESDSERWIEAKYTKRKLVAWGIYMKRHATILAGAKKYETKYHRVGRMIDPSGKKWPLSLKIKSKTERLDSSLYIAKQIRQLEDEYMKFSDWKRG